MKQITNMRKAVCVMANELKKAGYSLSEAFKKAWRQVKLSMTIRTEKGCAVVLVGAVEEYGFQKREPSRRVIKRCKKGG